MIKGIDVSRHNPKSIIEKAITKDKPQFMFIKATEGTTYVDGELQRNYKIAVEKGIKVGFYHYARAEKGVPVEEAEHFVSVVKPYMKSGAFLALDFEGESLNASPDWIRTFVKTVEKLVKGKCIIYIQASYFPGFRKAFDDNGLWLAHWGKDYSKNPYIGNYLISFHQTGVSDGIDRNIFHGDMEQLEKYLCYPISAITPGEGGLMTDIQEIQVATKDLENYACGLRNYILTNTEFVKTGRAKLIDSCDQEYTCTITDVCHFTTATGDINILTVVGLKSGA